MTGVAVKFSVLFFYFLAYNNFHKDIVFPPVMVVLYCLPDAVTVVVYNMMVSFHGSEVTVQAVSIILYTHHGCFYYYVTNMTYTALNLEHKKVCDYMNTRVQKCIYLYI